MTNPTSQAPRLLQDERDRAAENGPGPYSAVDMISHELRTPVTIILGYAEMLSNGKLGTLTPEQQEAILYIADGASDLRALADRACSALGVEAGMLRQAPKGVNEIAVEAAEDDVPRWRILVADDDESVAFAIQETLASLPHCETMVATSAREALLQCAQRPFHLLITDYRMPDMDGLTLAARVRQMHAQTAVILITAYGNESLCERAADASVRHILNKPVKLAEIRRATLDALDTLGERKPQYLGQIDSQDNDDKEVVSGRIP